MDNHDQVPAPKRHTGSEPFLLEGRPLAEHLRDFWSWSASDLLSNALRGQLAEYIVGMALGCVRGDVTRREWDAYDLVTRDGIKVEVKSTAYLQSWGTTTRASRRFGISETYGWDARTNAYSSTLARNSDVYVFCVHTATERSAANPLELGQWEFLVVATSKINQVLPQQKTIGLPVLTTTFGVSAVGFAEVAAAVHTAYAEGR